MKILILGFTKIKYMPYLDFYLRNISHTEHQIDVLYWNRDLKSEPMPYKDVNFIEFKALQKDDCARFLKIKNFVRYSLYCKKILKKNYDRMVILHTFPGVLNWLTLIKKYKNRYIYDFRDVTYEQFPIYRKIIASLVRNSIFTSVSSDGFRKYLPKDCENKIFTNHNIIAESLQHRDAVSKQTKPSTIRIAFWGFIREENLNKQIIKSIAKDKRFELHYYGREQQIAINLKQYAQSIDARNVFFHGEYNPEDRYEFVKNTDLIHNLYSETENMMLAMANKFYDGVIFYLPQICIKGSYMGKIVQENGLGFVVDVKNQCLLNDIYFEYNKINRKTFEKKCDICLQRFLNEMGLTKGALLNVFE